MMNGNYRTIAAVLIAVSLSAAATGAAAFTGPTPAAAPQPPGSTVAYSPPWNTGITEQRWPPSPPAAKVLADGCASVDVAALAGEDLVNYLRTTSEECLENTLHPFYNPSVRTHLPTVYSNRNMQSVFAEIEELAATYDGTNSSGILQLWSFVRRGYGHQRFFSEETGVGPFEAATDRAYLAASDAFAASDHFFDLNDVAAEILYHYFEVAYAAGMRKNHLEPIKQVLSGLTPERAANEEQAYHSFTNVIDRVYWTFSDHDDESIRNPGFIDAVSKDPEFVDALLQVTRYDFFFLVEDNHPYKVRMVSLERAIHVLVRLTRLESLRETAVAALTSVLSWHERFSGPFLIAARGLENQVDCASLNICRELLESEIYARVLPNKYSLDGGALVFDTSLPLEEVQPMYQGAKEIKARFHRLVETDEAVRHDIDVFTTRIYPTPYDYTVFEAYLGGVNSRQYSGGYYSNGTMATHVTPADQRGVGDNRDHVDVFLHEYGHYLADRFGLLRYGDLWFDEGLAEFLISEIPKAVEYAAARETRPDPAKLFETEYTYTFEDNYPYNFSHLFFHLMHQQRRTQLLELLDLVRGGDFFAYKGLIETWAKDARLAADFDSFLDEQVARVGSLPGSSFTYILPGALASASAEEIERALQQADGGLGMSCQVVETESERGFVCSGSLPAESGFSGDRGALNKHLNTRLDGFMTKVVDQGAINNLEAMTCYFANVAGSPPVADLRCEGPLRPEGQALTQVDLRASLFYHGGSSVNVGERIGLNAWLDFPEEAASNVTMTWSASLPVALLTSVGSSPCQRKERTSLAGVLDCGHIYGKKDGAPPLELSLHFTPMEAGTLEFSIEFSSDMPEIEPSDNVASLQLTITRISQLITTLSGHTGPVLSVAFSPDSTTLASGSTDGTVRLWDMETKTNTATLEGDLFVYSVAFSPNGKTLAAGLVGGTIKLWDLETNTNTATFEENLFLHSVAFSPVGSTLAAGLETGKVKLWDLETNTSTSFSWPVEHVRSVAFSPDGSTLAAGLGNGWDGSHHDATVKLVELGTESILTLSGHTLFYQVRGVFAGRRCPRIRVGGWHGQTMGPGDRDQYPL